MITFTLNGRPISTDMAADRTLLSLLREDLCATGTKVGCDIGRCGACTVLLDDQPVNACLILAGRLQGRRVTTIEGLHSHPLAPTLMAGLTQENAFQCGYCAPGMMMSLIAALAERRPSIEHFSRAIEGNICRCTGYHSILRGAMAAAARLEAEA